MEHETVQRDIGQRSAQLYVPLSVGIALAFLLATGWAGGYPLVAQIGGTIWVGLLSLIVSMPLVTARVKRRSSGL
jgi:hypothetical protein